ncbi:hypothetical protein [Bacteroides sp.]|uniref:hypothetical protein n=1 Tax=Bacteroides sp. TaxID=29523 RepID=UPI0025874099|nr:hypothetical protein [Bacteroides sp.]
MIFKHAGLFYFAILRLIAGNEKHFYGRIRFMERENGNGHHLIPHLPDYPREHI